LPVSHSSINTFSLRLKMARACNFCVFVHVLIVIDLLSIAVTRIRWTILIDVWNGLNFVLDELSMLLGR
jgi:hypothetical protein